MEAILKSEFAKRLHVSKARVSQMVAQGMPVTADGKIDVPAALNWIEQHIDQSHKDSVARRQSVPAAVPDAHPAPPPATPSQAGADRLPDPGRILLTAKAKRALVELRRAERMERKETGELVETVEVQRAIENMIANAKSKLLSLGHRLGPRVAIETDAAKCKDLIDGGVRDALADLVGYQAA
jgi:hypothetical protein